MFGKKKETQGEVQQLKELAELDERFFSQAAEEKEMFFATVSEQEESFRQVTADAGQLTENIKNAAALAADNVRTEEELLQQLAEHEAALADDERKRAALVQKLREIHGELTGLVDENKHFTSPSKYLSAVPAQQRTEHEAAREELSQMEEYGRQMGVLALNAAIEAGRLGDAGRQFVAAAEDIRVYASRYDSAIGQARERLAKSEAQITELEEQIHRLVTLLKENNVSIAKLMKACGEAADTYGEAADRDCSGLVNAVTMLRGGDEEIVKSEERNRMQMEDLAEEFLAQEKNHKELVRAVDPLYRHIIERKA